MVPGKKDTDRRGVYGGTMECRRKRGRRTGRCLEENRPEHASERAVIGVLPAPVQTLEVCLG
jgi:hypothetical protein